MKKMFKLIIALGISLAVTSVAYARNTTHYLPIDAAMAPYATAGKLDGRVKFYFADQRHPRVLQNFGSDIANRKTNAFGKSDETACNWAFLSGLVELQKQAHAVGANAVINITSYYDKKVMANNSQFECHAGAVVAGVVLKGDLVKVADR